MQRIHHYAESHDLKKMTFGTLPIKTLAYQNLSTKKNEDLVFIYIEGDGRPWKNNSPALDPNTNHSVSLPLMVMSNKPSLYLFRPCYGWLKMPPLCKQNLWTSARYSSDIVELLHQAINQHKAEYLTKKYVLVGHSGGGTIAMLLGAIRDDIAGIITIAANHDHQAWTNYFGYLPLHNSLSIPEESIYPENQQHWHLIGEKDKVIPLSIQEKAISRYHKATIIKYKDYNHQCCWAKTWKNIISLVEQKIQ